MVKRKIDKQERGGGLPFAFFSKRFKGSILLESMLSMIIVMTCFGVGISIYANVISTDNNRLRLRAQLLLEETAIRTKTEKRLLSETIEAELLRIVKIIAPYEKVPGLQQLQLEAYDAEGKKIAEHFELLLP